MCIIAVCDERVLTVKEVTMAAHGNPDGIGIAWHEKGVNVYRKGISVKELNDLLDSDLPLPLVIHFRFATSGDVTAEMCHPFACAPANLGAEGRSRHKLLFHNGVFSAWESMLVSLMPEIIKRYKKLPEGGWNDSRAIALAVGMFGEQVLEFISGKFALMKPDGTVDMYGDFKNNTGVYLSAPLCGYTIVHKGMGGIYDDDGYYMLGSGKESVCDSLEEDTLRGI